MNRTQAFRRARKNVAKALADPKVKTMLRAQREAIERDRLAEAVRLSAIMLLSAACFADDHGDRKAGRAYEKRAYANLKLIGREAPFMKAKRTKKPGQKGRAA